MWCCVVWCDVDVDVDVNVDVDVDADADCDVDGDGIGDVICDVMPYEIWYTKRDHRRPVYSDKTRRPISLRCIKYHTRTAMMLSFIDYITETSDVVFNFSSHINFYSVDGDNER